MSSCEIELSNAGMQEGPCGIKVKRRAEALSLLRMCSAALILNAV